MSAPGLDDLFAGKYGMNARHGHVGQRGPFISFGLFGILPAAISGKVWLAIYCFVEKIIRNHS